ncbi:MAG: hypothetical protein IKN90_07665 [Treponema sp.]|nr:hypothetical protein [Treponema sp.]
MAIKELNRFDTNAKRNVQIATKLTAVIGAVALICCFGIAFIAIYIFNANLRKDTEETLRHSADGVEFVLNDWMDSLYGAAYSIADRPDFIDLVVTKDWEGLKKLLPDKTIGFEIVAITDASGKIVPGGAKGISESANLMAGSAIKTALSGSVARSFGWFSDTDYAMVCAVPVRKDGKTIGTVLVGHDLVNGNLLNSLNNVFNLDVTVFRENLRMNTTLKDVNGKKMTGTKQ